MFIFDKVIRLLIHIIQHKRFLNLLNCQSSHNLLESTNINVVSSAIGVSVVLMNIFLADTFQTIIFDMRKLMGN